METEPVQNFDEHILKESADPFQMRKGRSTQRPDAHNPHRRAFPRRVLDEDHPKPETKTERQDHARQVALLVSWQCPFSLFLVSWERARSVRFSHSFSVPDLEYSGSEQCQRFVRSLARQHTPDPSDRIATQ